MDKLEVRNIAELVRFAVVAEEVLEKKNDGAK
jgi:hypothetical protein